MFEVAVDEWAGPDPTPPDDSWRVSDDTALTALVAADPERPRTASELLADAVSGRWVDLRGIDPDALCADEQVALVQLADRHTSSCTAVKLRAVDRFTGPAPDEPVAAALNDYAFAWCEISAALGIGEGAARTLVANATELLRRLPRTFAALLAGEISYVKVLRILDATAQLSDDQCRELEDLVIGKAGARTHAAHAKAVGRAVAKVDPDGWKHRRERRLNDVALIRHSHGDGVADLLARNVDGVDAETIWTAADTWARSAKSDGDPRTLDALRVAALVDFARRYLTGQPMHDTADDTAGTARTADPATDGRPDATPAAPGSAMAGAAAPTRHGMPVTVNVIIGLPWLLGLSRTPGMLAGTGDPLPADAIADLLHTGARIRFALVDTHGTLQGISRTTHDPDSLTRVFVALRDVVLRVPGGSITTLAGQDLDHLDPHGATTPGNLHSPSRGWHRAKTYKHWTVRPNKDGTITWTSRRTGRTYTTHPHDHRDVA